MFLAILTKNFLCLGKNIIDSYCGTEPSHIETLAEWKKSLEET